MDEKTTRLASKLVFENFRGSSEFDPKKTQEIINYLITIYQLLNNSRISDGISARKTVQIFEMMRRSGNIYSIYLSLLQLANPAEGFTPSSFNLTLPTDTNILKLLSNRTLYSPVEV